MSGKLLFRALLKEIGHKRSPEKIEHLERLHKKNFGKRLSSIRVLPGARELVKHLSEVGVRWAIGTSGDQKTADSMIKLLRVPSAAPVITGDDVERAKPDPDIFFLAAANRLGVALSDCIVIGDSVWDLLAARRAKALGIGLICGGYGQSELDQAGAYRVYEDPADLLERIAEIDIQSD